MSTPTIANKPIAYKAGKIYSQLPVDGSADFDVTRNSTSTRVNKDGLIEEVGFNVPKLDYTSGGCPVWLLEPESTNLVAYSEDFSDSSWNKLNANINADSAISPDGTLNADLINKLGVNENDRISYSLTLVNGRNYCVSAFFKNNDMADGAVSSLGVRMNGGSLIRQGVEWNEDVLQFTNDGSNGTRTNQEIKYYGNGWYRVCFVFTADAVSANIEIDLDRIIPPSTNSLYLWGVQMEEQYCSTSYIPTNGSTVTRAAESVYKSGVEDYINSSRGVLYFEGYFSGENNNKRISLSDGTSNNYIQFGINTNNNTQCTIVVGGVSQFNISSPSGLVWYQTSKIAIYYSVNDFKVYIDGDLFESGTSGTTFSNDVLNQIRLSRYDGTGNDFHGKLKELKVYDKVLTDTELQQLTQ